MLCLVWGDRTGRKLDWMTDCISSSLCVSYVWCEGGLGGERGRIGGGLLGQGAGATGHSLFSLGGDTHKTV